MKKINLNILLFIIVIYSISCLNFIASFRERPSISVLENRALQKKPVLTISEVLSGGYFRKYEEYFSDNFIFRDNFVLVSNNIKKLAGIPNKDGVSLVEYKGENIAENTKVTENEENVKIINENLQNNKEKTDKIKNNEKGNVVGKLLILNDTVMSVFHFNEENCKKYSGMINNFVEKSSNNINVYSILIPTNIEFLESTKYKNISDSQKSAIDFINKSLDTKVKKVDAYSALMQHKNEYIYFRTDHHWTALGAYYAYTAFSNSLGIKPIPIEQYDTTKVTGFLGSSYSETLNKKLEKNPDTIVLYKPFTKHEYHIYYDGPLKMNLLDMNHATKKNKYRIFLSGDRPLGIIKTDVKNGKKIIVLKDSFGNAFIPFLIPHYEEIIIVDSRQYESNINKIIAKMGIQDVLFINYTSAAGMKDYIELLSNLLKTV